METENKLPRLEIIAVLLGALFLWLLLAQANGREAHTDVLWYMNMSQNHIPDPHWFTRYTHVFLQAPFLTTSANPFDGIVWFWAFIIASSAALIYFLHRLLFPSSTFIHAGLSVGLFLAFDLHGASAGVPLADLSATLVILAIVLSFWLITRHGSPSISGLVILGILFVVAFKTKETIWIVGLLVFGVLGDGKGKIFTENWFKRSKWIAVGLIGGVFGFALLNAAFLRDFLFDLRPAHWGAYLAFWIGDAEYFPGAENWLVDGFMLIIPFVFLLYLAAGYKLPEEARKHKLVWALPFATILFLTLGMVRSTYLVDPRFLFPSQAIMTVFIPSLFPFNLPDGARDRWLWFGKLVGGLGIYVVLYEGLKLLIAQTAINFTDFVSSFFIPVVVALLLLIILVRPKQAWLNTLIPAVLLVAFIRPGLLDNLRQFQLRPPENGFQTRFYPLYAFGDEITPTADDSYLISTSIPDQGLGFSEDIDTIRTIFDLYYGIRSERQQFSVVELPLAMDLLLDASGPGYLFVVTSELEALQDSGPLPDQCKVFQLESYELLLIRCID